MFTMDVETLIQTAQVSENVTKQDGKLQRVVIVKFNPILTVDV